ncbi:MAG: hypothetical protein ACLS8T_31415 [Anaerobutyricum sp.]
MASITQDMRYRLSLIRFAEKYGVSKAAIKYKTNRQYIYRWKRRYDGTINLSAIVHAVPITIPISIHLKKSS